MTGQGKFESVIEMPVFAEKAGTSYEVAAPKGTN